MTSVWDRNQRHNLKLICPSSACLLLHASVIHSQPSKRQRKITSSVVVAVVGNR